MMLIKLLTIIQILSTDVGTHYTFGKFKFTKINCTYSVWYWYLKCEIQIDFCTPFNSFIAMQSINETFLSYTWKLTSKGSFRSSLRRLNCFGSTGINCLKKNQYSKITYSFYFQIYVMSKFCANFRLIFAHLI